MKAIEPPQRDKRLISDKRQMFVKKHKISKAENPMQDANTRFIAERFRKQTLQERAGNPVELTGEHVR